MSKGQEEQLGRVFAHAQPLTEAEIAEIDETQEALEIQLKRFFEGSPLYRPWPVPGTEPRTTYRSGEDEVEIPAAFRIEMPEDTPFKLLVSLRHCPG
jgi:hypothetical protein